MIFERQRKGVLHHIHKSANAAAGKIWGLGAWAEYRLKDAERDRTFAQDHAAIEAMIGPYRDKHFAQVPPDPRTIDPAVIRSIRERLEDTYYYQWRATRADAELTDALYAGCVQAHGGRFTLCVRTTFLDDAGRTPPHWWSPGGSNDAYKRYYDVTACSVDVRPFITAHDDAVGLLGSVLPGWGYSLRYANGRNAVRLERGGEVGPWKEGPPALALVTAILDRLERFPEEAAHWRKI